MSEAAPSPTQSLKQRGAALSVASNSALILLKVVAGSLTGSVAVLTEALHSSVDLVASIIAFISVRKADEPADADHPYGHEKIEDLSAAVEGILILVGSGVIVFEAVRHLVLGSHVQRVGIGIAVVGVSMVVNLIVAAELRRRARVSSSPALAADAAHLSTDALTSGGVLVGLIAVQLTGEDWLDPAVALTAAGLIVFSGVRIITRSSRVLVDEGLPAAELAAIREAILSFQAEGVVGFHKLRARRGGAQRHVDVHVQFAEGTSLEDAHATAHLIQDDVVRRLGSADVLIHLEPQDRVRPEPESGPGPAGGSAIPAG